LSLSVEQQTWGNLPSQLLVDFLEQGGSCGQGVVPTPLLKECEQLFIVFLPEPDPSCIGPGIASLAWWAMDAHKHVVGFPANADGAIPLLKPLPEGEGVLEITNLSLPPFE
jgi:hypothetical protein